MKLKIVCVAAGILLAAFVVAQATTNGGIGFPSNGPCTPTLTSPGICNDNGTLISYDVSGKKTPIVGGTQGPPGPKGDPGPTGAAGAQGPPGAPATLVGSVCRFNITSFTMDGKGGASGVLTIISCP